MQMIFILAALVCLTVFAFGVLAGSSLNTRVQTARGRRQAAVQRDLNLQWRALRENQEEAGEELLR